MSSSNPWTRVIVLTAPPPATSTVAAFTDFFRERDWFAIEQHDPYLAMAELCLREKAQIARAAWGLQRLEEIALFIADGDHYLDSQIRELTDAVDRYLPNATIWRVCDGEIQAISSRPNLNSAVDRIPGRHSSQSNAVNVGPHHESRATPSPDHGLQSTKLAESHLDAQTRLSRQEINMLLEDSSSTANGAAP